MHARHAGAPLAVLAAAAFLAPPAAAQQFTPLLDLAKSLQKRDIDNFQLDMACRKLLPGDKDLLLSLTRADGKWYPRVTGRSPGYSQGAHSGDANSLRLEGDRITGTIPVVIRPDKWVPKDGKPRQIAVKVDAYIDPGGEDWSLKGTFETTYDGEKRAGELAGTFDRALRNNHWTAGKWSDGGVALAFDMGDKRVNWNKGDWSVCTFYPARDLSKYWGLRVRVAADKPRGDAEVAVWLGEADGSWYYVPRAVPLVDKDNEALLPFSAFSVAEWVCPGNHMDEDYVLDLGNIGAVAVGVVNPFGVGQVSFRLTALELVSRDAAPPPARVEFTGKVLSVNRHEVVPAGIFGGYANFLPQRYRPGCQRNLAAPTSPQIPMRYWLDFDAGHFTDWQAMVKALRGEAPEHKKLADYLMGLLRADEQGKQTADRFARFDIDKHLDRIRKNNEQPNKDPRRWRRMDPDAAPGELTGVLNAILHLPRIYDKDAFAGVAIGPELKARLDRLDQLNDTRVMEVNRRLLEAAFPKLIRPLKGGGPTEMFYINCFGERKNTATMLHVSDWKEFFTSYGTKLGENALRYGVDGKPGGLQNVWEFWNEPYLHWNRDRINRQAGCFNTDKAVEGGPVQIRWKKRDGGWIDGPVVPHFKWAKPTTPKERATTAPNGLCVVDETCFTFWSGKGDGWMYDQMFAAAASAIKKANPHVEVIAGWGFRWQEDHWAAWDILYKNTIDRGIQWIDGVHEHHYQGETIGMQAAAEVLTAYGVTKHNKWLHSFNTETNDLIDSPARGAVSTPENRMRANEYRRLIYNLRDLIYSVQENPDKYRGRTMIHYQATPTMTDVCFGLLADLRGRLVEADKNDGKIWAVASIDGTDPNAMPPGFDGTPHYVAVVFNDDAVTRKVTVALKPPAGMTFAAPGTVERTTVDKETFAIARPVTPGVKVEKDGASFDVEMPEHSAWKIAIPLAGKIPAAPEVVRTQYFSGDILAAARRDKPFATKVKLDPAVLKSARRAWLRAVVEDVGVGEGVATVGSQKVALPVVLLADNVPGIINVPLEAKALAADNDVTFATNPGNFAGYRVDMVSIVLEQRKD